MLRLVNLKIISKRFSTQIMRKMKRRMMKMVSVTMLLISCLMAVTIRV